jgi:hypothetical protein
LLNTQCTLDLSLGTYTTKKQQKQVRQNFGGTGILKTMKKIFTLTVAITAILIGLGLAQETLPFQPNCKVTLSTQPDDFMEMYSQKNNNQSEAGYDEAALYWADCKAIENNARVAKFPALKAKLKNLYNNYNQFFSLETELAYEAAGGGTMYPHGRARFQPYIELHFSKLIGLLTSKTGASKSAAITARYNKAKQNLEKRLNQVQTTPNPFVDGYTATEVKSKKAEWLETAKNYALQYSNIRKNIGSGIDLASTTILEFLAKGIWAEEL